MVCLCGSVMAETRYLSSAGDDVADRHLGGQEGNARARRAGRRDRRRRNLLRRRGGSPRAAVPPQRARHVSDARRRLAQEAAPAGDPRGAGAIGSRQFERKQMSEHDILEILRIVAVMALVCVAAALATPKGRLPLALRGLAKMLNAVPSPSRRQEPAGDPRCHASRRGGDGTVSAAKRLLAFALVILAILLALV